MTTKTMEHLLSLAFEKFNAKMKTNYSFDNIKIGYYTKDNADEEVRKFCEKDFPYSLRFPHDLTDAAASAFVGEKIDGIMIHKNALEDQEEFFTTMLHELSHIFCTHNEIPGGDFFKRYCDGTAENDVFDGYINAGYAVWREFIADYLASEIQGLVYHPTLNQISEYIFENAELVTPNDLVLAKLAMSVFLHHIMVSKEAHGGGSWESVNLWLNKKKLTEFITITNLVYIQIRSERFWEITPDFIEALGGAYIFTAYRNGAK